MIAQLSGTALAVSASAIVVEVGGLGLEVLSTPSTLAGARVGQDIRLHTHLVVREESLTLFGFATAGERDTFEALQSVTGVGPRLALGLLAVHSPADLVAAVQTGDRSALERVPGVGQKVAARLVLELGGKLSVPSDGPSSYSDGRDQVADALAGLGWPVKLARSAVDAVAPGPVSGEDVPEVLRASLQWLGSSRG